MDDSLITTQELKLNQIMNMQQDEVVVQAKCETVFSVESESDSAQKMPVPDYTFETHRRKSDYFSTGAQSGRASIMDESFKSVVISLKNPPSAI